MQRGAHFRPIFDGWSDIGNERLLATWKLCTNERRVEAFTMKIITSVTVLVLYGFAAGAYAQGHGGGHGGGHAGGGHSGGGHSGGSGHAGGGHAGGGHSSSGQSSGGNTGSTGRSRGGSPTGAHGGHVSGTSTAEMQSTASARTNSAARAKNGRVTAARGSMRASANQIEEGVPPYARPRDGRDPIGTAVPRASVVQSSSSTAPTILLSGVRSYPLFFNPALGFRLGRYGFGLYDWGYFDPWYGPAAMAPAGGLLPDVCGGSLRLRVKPNDARVFVDGQFVGVVDDFDGIFQKLHLTCDPHRIEVQADGYEPLVFDARITPGHKTTYEGVLRRIQ